MKIPKVKQNTTNSIKKIIEAIVYIFSIWCLSLNDCLWFRIYQSKVTSRDQYIFSLTTKIWIITYLLISNDYLSVNLMALIDFLSVTQIFWPSGHNSIYIPTASSAAAYLVKQNSEHFKLINAYTLHVKKEPQPNNRSTDPSDINFTTLEFFYLLYNRR